MKCNNHTGFFLLSLLISVSFFSYSQEEFPKNKYYLSTRVSCTIPHIISNAALRRSFLGIYDIGTSVSVNPFSGITAGIAYSNVMFTVPANKISGLSSTTMRQHNAGFRLGYDHYISEMTFFTFVMNAGKNFTFFSGVPVQNAAGKIFEYESTYLSPEVDVNFFIEESFAIGITLSFNHVDKPFSPDFIGLNNHASYTAKDYKGSTSYINIGFGFYYGFARKKSAGPRSSMDDF